MCAYLKTYDKEITDMEQPLLVSRLKREVSLFLFPLQSLWHTPEVAKKQLKQAVMAQNALGQLDNKIIPLIGSQASTSEEPLPLY